MLAGEIFAIYYVFNRIREVLPMVSTDMLNAKKKASTSLMTDVEKFLSSGGTIQRCEEKSGDEVQAKLSQARRSYSKKQKAEARAKFRRIAMIARANRKLNGNPHA